ncbi:MAG: thioredoxin TrxC [Gammaproteobacteria bacterium]|jgi:thioredoxin 2
MSEHTLVVCSQCNSINRLPNDKLTAGGKCGVCHLPLFSGQPAELTSTNFQRFTQKNQLPVVIDYWAPWCGPCKMMAPVFASVTQQMEPYVRFAKVNTEAEQALAAQANIRSIPTLAIYRDGRELTRQAGAMDQQGLVAWIKQNI